MREDTHEEKSVKANQSQILRTSSLIMMLVVGAMACFVRIGDSHELSVHDPPSEDPTVKKLVNPYEVTEDFLAKGKELFQRKAFCAGCHGPNGTGNGMESNPYDVRGPFPVNFTDPKWQALRSDGEIFWTLKRGVRGTDMAPFIHLVLSEEGAWQIVAYIRTLKKP